MCQQARFLDDTNTMVASGVEGVFHFKLIYQGATDKRTVDKLDPLGTRLSINLKLVQHLQGVDQWVKGIQVDSEMNILFAWSLTRTSMYELRTGKHHFTFEGLLNEQEDVINDMIYMPKYRYIVIGSQRGRIIVYKWAAEATIVKEFKGVERAIKGLNRHPNRVNQFITASLDQTIRIWCLEKFSQQYVLRIPFEIKMVRSLGNLQFGCFERNQIQVCRLQDIVQMMHKSQTNAVSLGQCFIDMEHQHNNSPYALFAQFRDNSIKLLAPQPVADVKMKSTIYPPPNAQDVTAVRFSSVLKQVILLVSSGVLYFYRLEQGTSVMVKQVRPNELRDSDNNLLEQRLTCFEVGCLEPSRFDCNRHSRFVSNLERQDTYYERSGDGTEDFRERTDPSIDTEETSLLETDPEERVSIPDDAYLIMGFHRGQIIIYNIFNFDNLLSRHEVCRNKILMVREVRPSQMYIVYDDTHQVVLCQLQHTGVQKFHQFNTFRPLFQLSVRNSNVYFAYEQGDVDFFEVVALGSFKMDRRVSKYPSKMTASELKTISKNEIMGKSYALVRYDIPKEEDSEDGISAFTVSPSSGLMASADHTGLIKIWSEHKQLIREVKFPEPVQALHFIDHRDDLMIGHGKTISLVTAKQFLAQTQPVWNYSIEELIDLAQEVTNQRMHYLFSKESALRPFKKDKRQFREEAGFGNLSDTSSDIEEAPTFDSTERLTDTNAEVKQSVKIKIAQEARSKKTRSEAKEILIRKAAMGSDYPVEDAKQQSDGLARRAIEQEKKRQLLDEKIRKIKERHKKANDLAQIMELSDSKKKGKSKKAANTNAPDGVSARLATEASSTMPLESVISLAKSKGSVAKIKPRLTSTDTQAKSTQPASSRPAQQPNLKLPKERKSTKVPLFTQSPSSRAPVLSIRSNKKDFVEEVANASDSIISQEPLLPSDFVYNPNTPAVPLNVIQENYDRIKNGMLHPKRQSHSIRREITEQRISSNIAKYNSAVAAPNTNDLFIGSQVESLRPLRVDSSTQMVDLPHTNSAERLSVGSYQFSATHTQSEQRLHNRQRNYSIQHDNPILLTRASGQTAKHYGNAQLAKYMLQRPQHRRLISELRQRNGGLLNVAAQRRSKFSLHSKGAESQQMLQKNATRLSLDGLNQNYATGLAVNRFTLRKPVKTGAAAQDSIFGSSQRQQEATLNRSIEGLSSKASTKDPNPYNAVHLGSLVSTHFRDDQSTLPKIDRIKSSRRRLADEGSTRHVSNHSVVMLSSIGRDVGQDLIQEEALHSSQHSLSALQSFEANVASGETYLPSQIGVKNIHRQQALINQQQPDFNKSVKNISLHLSSEAVITDTVVMDHLEDSPIKITQSNLYPKPSKLSSNSFRSSFEQTIGISNQGPEKKALTLQKIDEKSRVELSKVQSNFSDREIEMISHEPIYGDNEEHYSSVGGEDTVKVLVKHQLDQGPTEGDSASPKNFSSRLADEKQNKRNALLDTVKTANTIYQ